MISNTARHAAAEGNLLTGGVAIRQQLRLPGNATRARLTEEAVVLHVGWSTRCQSTEARLLTPPPQQ